MPLTGDKVVAIAATLPERELRRKILASLPRIKATPRVKADDFSGLNLGSLKRLTQQLRALGFKPLMDISVLNRGQSQSQGFSRFFVHPRLGCYAETMATEGMMDSGAPLLCGMMSYLTGGWSVGVGNKQPSEADYLIRLPKSVRAAFPGASPEALLKKHLFYRDRMTEALKLRVLRDASGKLHLQRMKAAPAEIRKHLAKRNLQVDLLMGHAARQAKEWEWLGDFPKAVYEAHHRGDRKALALPKQLAVELKKVFREAIRSAGESGEARTKGKHKRTSN
jgi:hypothetical protein